MTTDRTQLYDSLESQIGNTPLVELPLDLPRGNRVLVKEEFRNPTGSHYDRVFIYLIRELEEQGKIIPGVTPLIETTSGSAGESFAWICQQLDYEANIVLPENAPPKKVRAMVEYGANLFFTPKEEAIGGTARELRRILVEDNLERERAGLQKYFCPNHSRDSRTLDAFEKMGREVLDVTDIDYFIAAIGNGTSLLGPGRHFKQELPQVYILGWEPLESGLAYSLRFPGRLEEIYGLETGSFRHDLPGTGVPDVEFPFLEQAVLGRDFIVDEIALVQGKNTEPFFRFKVDPNNYIGRQACAMSSVHTQWANVRRLADWENGAKILKSIGHPGGRTTAGGVELARRMIESPDYVTVWKQLWKLRIPWSKAEYLEDKTFLVLGYDTMEKY